MERGPAQHHPYPRRGVEGSQGAGVVSAPLSPPRPPASPPGVAGRLSWRARSLQPDAHPLSSPQRTAPTWANIVRGDTCTQRKAPTTSPADVIALYQHCVAAGIQARFSVKNIAGHEEVYLSCRFPDTTAARPPPAHRRRQLENILASPSIDRPTPPVPPLTLPTAATPLERNALIATPSNVEPSPAVPQSPSTSSTPASPSPASTPPPSSLADPAPSPSS